MVFYLKVNREKEYTKPNLKHWLNVASVDSSNEIFILCDNEILKRDIQSDNEFDYDFEFIESNYSNEEIEEIVDNTTLGAWGRIAYAHLTTFWHAQKHGYKAFWNIDADDTMFCASSLRIFDILKEVEKRCSEERVHMTNLDMWHSISIYERWSEVPHWSFGITYTDNTVDWFRIMKEHMNDEDYHNMRKLHSNIDWFFTYLQYKTDCRINSFYVENLKFIHFYSNFIDYPHKGTLYHYNNKRITFPILKYFFGLEEMGEIEIANDDMIIDSHILDTEATIALIGKTKEKEVFAKEMKKIMNYDDLLCKRLEIIRRKNNYENIVFYGAGDYLYRNYEMLRKANAIDYISDSDSSKWGRKIIDDYVCIKPEEILNLSNYLVVISVEQVTTSFEIVKFLRSIGVEEIDHIDNFRRYLMGLE